MKTSIEEAGAIHRKIRVEVPWETIRSELDSSYRKLGRQARIPGFRPGKVPVGILKQRYGKQVVEEVLERVIEGSFEAACIQNKLRPVSRPELEKGRFEEGKPFVYTATVEVEPEIELKNIDVDVERKSAEVSDEMVDAEIRRLLEEKAVLVPIEGRDTAQMGDTAIIDYVAKRNGEPIEGGQAQNHPLTLGSEKALPGFSENIVGMKKGQEKSFELEFPEGWGPPQLVGKKVQFEVKLHELKARELPELNDAFVEELGIDGVKSVDDLKEHVRKTLLEKEQRKLDAEAKSQLLEKLVEANPFEVPPSMVASRQESLAREMEFYMYEQGLNIYESGIDRERLKRDVKGRAEWEVKAAMLLRAAAKKFGLEVTEAELDEEIGKIASGSGEDAARIKALYSEPRARRSVAARLLEDKVLDFLLKRPNVSEETAPEHPGAEEQPETSKAMEQAGTTEQQSGSEEK